MDRFPWCFLHSLIKLKAEKKNVNLAIESDLNPSRFIKLIDSIRRQFGYNYVSLMPTNLYGTQDNFDLNTSHVLPAMIRKFHEGKINNAETVTIWGTGDPKREFLYVDDLADACIFFLFKTFNLISATYEL